MADFVAVLRKTIDGLADNTPAMREKVYDKARNTVAAKLAAITPPPPAAVAERQRQVLEDAIRQVEAGYAGEADDPFAELENVFAPPAQKAPEPMAAKAPPPIEAKAPPALELKGSSSFPPATQFSQTRVSAPLPPLPASQPEPAPWPGDEAQFEAAPEELPDEAAAEPLNADDQGDEDGGIYEEYPERRRSFMPLIAAVLVLALLAGGGYAVWLNKDDFVAMLGLGGETVASSGPKVGDTAPLPPPEPKEVKSSVNDDDSEGPQKFTQRLNTDGTEVDPGPAGGIASIGEGTSVAAATQPSLPVTTDAAPADDPAAAAAAGDAATAAAAPDAGDAAVPATGDAAAPATGDAAIPATGDAAAPATGDAATPAQDTATAGTGPVVNPAAPAAPDPAATDDQGQVAIGQKAIFYEERTNVAEGSAEPGTVVWSLGKESPGEGQPEEAAIHAEATIPGKDVQLRLTIRRNVDKTLPASHIIELIFLTPEGFDGGGIDKVLRFALKSTEEDPGSQLLAIPPTEVAPGYFLVALNDTKAEIETNLQLLKREQWIDVPVVYENGRRAVITLEKGLPGDKVFDEVIKAWQSQTSG
jgi:hypothetical protein